MTMPRILVVDDDRDIRDLLEQALTEIGLAVTLAQNGHEALSVLQQGGRWVVVLDLMMPVMSGAEVVEQLMRVPPAHWQCKVILISASWGRKQPSSPQMADLVVAQMPKPFDLDELLEMVLSARQNLERELAPARPPPGSAVGRVAPSR